MSGTLGCGKWSAYVSERVTETPGFGLDFDGSNDYASVTDHASLDLTSSFAIEAWVRLDAAGSTRRWIGKSNVGATTGFCLGALSTSKLRFDSLGVGFYDTTNYTIPTGEWTHVAVVMDGSFDLTYIINGVFLETVAGASPVLTNSDNVAIGALGVSSLTQFWLGRVDDLRIWNTTRTPAQVLANMNQRLKGTETGLVAYWPMDEGRDNLADDKSSNNNVATLASGTASPRWVQGVVPYETTTPKRWLLPFNTLDCSRVIDDVSAASVTLGCSVKGMPSFLSWGHELVLYRDESLMWAGPIMGTHHERDTMTITANDAFAWMDKRRLEYAFDVSDDLSVVFAFIFNQANLRDPIGLSVTPVDCGVVGRRTNDRSGTTRAGDLLRELARTAVDFTVIGRDLLVGGTIPGQVRNIILGDESWARFQGDSDGGGMASEVQLTGSSANIVAVAGGIGTYGLVQASENESTIEDTASLQAAADARVELLSTDYFKVTGDLKAEASVRVGELIPGYVARVQGSLTGRDVDEDMRIVRVGFSVSDVETVSLEFAPMGAS